ncbi:hypothetical protein P4H71_07500 [Paenibacillus kribbensis]|uniref:hypothetical protein n=1 Tax=Paenibacillus kribbensis TaxID=172713 RepID=UPI002DB7AD47|nr:hypothetical protein [Paenibacillus kribbensis]MEC0234175.1 hypothetical protein [Paenibacillus kribbensis]
MYREELEEYERKGIVTLHTAFSRETGKEKTYVQHLMVKDNQKIMEVLNDNNGTLYICGDGTRMAPDVEASLRQAYSSVYGKDEQAAAEWLEQLQQSGRYAKDVWAGL